MQAWARYGNLVVRFDHLGRPAQRRGGIAVLARHRTRLAGQGAIPRQDLGRATGVGLGLVPLDHQRGAALVGRPVTVGHDRDAGRDLHHVLHPGNRPGRRGVHPRDRRAESGRVQHHRRQHTRQLHILGEDGFAHRLVAGVDPGGQLPDQPKILRILEGYLLRHRHGGGFDRKGGIAGPFATFDLAHQARLRGERGCLHTPVGRCGRDQHRARGGPRRPQLLPRVRHRGAATGALDRAHQRVVVLRGVGGCSLHPHLLPLRVEFLGHDRRETGVGPLPHFEVLGDHRHRAIGPDPDEGVGDEVGSGRDRGPAGPTARQLNGQHQPAGGDARTDEIPPGHFSEDAHASPSCPAAR